MEPVKGMFGNGQKTCRICDKQLTDKRRLSLEIKHSDGTLLAKLSYFAPLCEEHRGGGGEDSIKVGIEWEDVIPIDQTLS